MADEAELGWAGDAIFVWGQPMSHRSRPVAPGALAVWLEKAKDRSGLPPWALAGRSDIAGALGKPAAALVTSEVSGGADTMPSAVASPIHPH